MKRDFPPNYGNDYKEQWKEGDFHVGDPVECGFQNIDYGIILQAFLRLCCISCMTYLGNINVIKSTPFSISL